MNQNNLCHKQSLRLKIFSEKLRPDVYEIQNKQTLIGRSHKCDIVISDEGLEDYEILIGINNDGNHFIQSLSFNQDLIINGKKKKKTSLKTGDLISFGILEGIFEPSSIPQLPIEDISLNKHNIYEENDIVFDESPIFEVIPLEECSFNYQESETGPIPKKSEGLIKTEKLHRPIVKIQYFSCGILISEDKKEFISDEITICSKSGSNNIWGPIFDNTDEIPFLKKNKNGDLFFKSLPGFNGFTEVTAKEGHSSGWRRIEVGEEIHFYKGPNLMILTVSSKEFILARPPFLEMDKYGKNILIYSLLIFMIFLCSSFFVESQKERPVIKKEIMINFSQAEKEKKAMPPNLPQKVIKPVPKTFANKKVYKKINKKKKLKKGDLNKALDDFLKGPDMIDRIEKKSIPKTSSFLRKIKNNKVSDPKVIGKNMKDVIKQLKGEGTLKSIFKKTTKKELIKYKKKTIFLGAMDPELIRKILKKYLPQFKFCFQQDLAFEKTKKGGIVDLKFSVNKFGKVKDIAIGFKKKNFSDTGINCMKKVLSFIKFPRPKGGGKVRIRQPLNFSTEKGNLAL